MQHYDLKEIIDTTTNFKSSIIEWCQKHNKDFNFAIVEETGSNHKKQFKTKLAIDGKEIAEGSGYSKKKAEQDAARKACDHLKIL